MDKSDILIQFTYGDVIDTLTDEQKKSGIADRQEFAGAVAEVFSTSGPGSKFYQALCLHAAGQGIAAVANADKTATPLKIVTE